jgi:hypothetical protein
MTEKFSSCQNCGASEFRDGHLVWNAPIRFKTPDQGSFRRGTKVEARACTGCGHIALFLEKK